MKNGTCGDSSDFLSNYVPNMSIKIGENKLNSLDCVC